MPGDAGPTGDAGTAPSGADQRRLSRRALLGRGCQLGLLGGLATAIGDAFGGDWVAPIPGIPGGEELGTITYALARQSPGGESLSRRQTAVPPEWHRRLRLAFAARERLREVTVEPLVGALVVPGTYDDPEAGLSLVATAERVVDRVAALLDPFPLGLHLDIDLVESRPAVPLSGGRQLGVDAYRLSSDDLVDGRSSGDPASRDEFSDDGSGGTAEGVPGGVVCESAAMSGTLAPALFDAASGERYFATSNHVFGAGGAASTRHAGETLSLRTIGRPLPVGTVDRGYPSADVVQVAPSGRYRPAPALARADPGGVVGQYTAVGLADLAAREEPLTKYGAVSGRTSGQIHGVDGVTCYTGRICKTGQLTWGGTETLVDGDSGSVAVHPDPEHPEESVLVAGINNARTRWVGDFTWGTAAHHLYSAYGLHF